MILELDLDLMKAYKLSLEEYALLLLLHQGKFEKVRTYFSKEEDLSKLVEKLVQRKYIILKEYGIKDRLTDYKVLFVPHYLKNDMDKWFDELVAAYPNKVKRPNLEEDNLIVNLPKCKLLYKAATKGNKNNHEHIMECLKYQVDFLKKRTTGLMYMKRLYKWLEEEGWKDYEDAMLKVKKYAAGNIPSVNDNIGETPVYGQRII
jgi:hypothetical protein